MTDFSSLDYDAAALRNDAAQDIKDHSLISVLQPSIQRDGDQWCILYGEDLQSGVSGFGESPYLAVMDFNIEWYKKNEH